MATYTPTYIDNYEQKPDKEEKGNNIRLRVTILSAEDTSPQDNKVKITWKLTLESIRHWSQLSAYRVDFGGDVVESHTAISNWSSGQAIKMDGTNATRTTTLQRNSDGTLSFNVTIRQLFYVGYSATRWASDTYCEQITSTVQMSQLYRTSVPTLNVSRQNVGSVIRINTNRYANFTHTIYYSIGGISNELIATGIGDYKDWTLPDKINNQITSGTEMNGTIRVITDGVGENSVGFTAVVPSSVVPTVSSLTVSEGNSVVSGKGWNLGSQKYIQNLSKLNVSSSTSGAKGSTITNTTYTLNGNAIPDKLTTSGSQTVAVSITDSRGRTASKSQAITVIAYNNPTITSASAKRCNADGTDNDNGTSLKYTFKGSISPINNGTSNFNTKAYKISYREKGTSSWTDVSITNNAYTIDKTDVVLSGKTFADTKSFEIKFSIIDAFNTTEITKTLETGFDLINFTADGKGIGFGIVASESNVIDVGNSMTMKYHGKVVNTAGVNTGKTSSDTDTYSCNYINNITNNLIVVTYNSSIGSFSPNGEKYDQYISFDIPSGYIPIAVAGFGLSGYCYTLCGINLAMIVNNQLKYSVRNFSNTYTTGDITLWYNVLFVSNRS